MLGATLEPRVYAFVRYGPWSCGWSRDTIDSLLSATMLLTEREFLSQ